MTPTILSVAVVVACVLVLRTSVRVVPASRAGLVERLGRHQRTLEAGIHFVAPMLDRLQHMVDLREQMLDMPRRQVHSAGGRKITADPILYYQVTDPVRATYDVTDVVEALERETSTRLRQIAGTIELDHAVDLARPIAAQLSRELQRTVSAWGVQINRIELALADESAAGADAPDTGSRP